MLTAGDRALALRVFDQLAARVSLPAPPLVAIHADLTPTNIIVGTDGRVTILDFAMAKSGARHHDVSHLFFHFDRLSWRRLMPRPCGRRAAGAAPQFRSGGFRR